MKSVKITNIVHNKDRHNTQVQLKSIILNHYRQTFRNLHRKQPPFSPMDVLLHEQSSQVSPARRSCNKDGVPSEFVNFRLLSTFQLSTNWNIGLRTRDLF